MRGCRRMERSKKQVGDRAGLAFNSVFSKVCRLLYYITNHLVVQQYNYIASSSSPYLGPNENLVQSTQAIPLMPLKS
jgi:hypothetical protein